MKIFDRLVLFSKKDKCEFRFAKFHLKDGMGIIKDRWCFVFPCFQIDILYIP